MSAFRCYNRYLGIAVLIVVMAAAVWAVAVKRPEDRSAAELMAGLHSDDVALRIECRQKLEALDPTWKPVLNHLCADIERQKISALADRYLDMGPSPQDMLYARTPKGGDGTTLTPPGTYDPSHKDGLGRLVEKYEFLRSAAQDRIVGDWLDGDGKADKAILLNRIDIGIASVKAMKPYSGPLPPLPLPPARDSMDLEPPAGREEYVRILKSTDMVEQSPEDLIKLGRRRMAEIQKEMDRLANEMRPGATPNEVLREISLDHTTAAKLLPLAQQEADAAIAFVTEKGFAPVPEGTDGVTAIEQKDPYSFAPYSAYAPSSRWWEKKFVGEYVVETGREMSPEDQKRHLESMNRASLRITCVHETFPGHHLQEAYEWKHPPSPLRKLAACQTYVEGWAMYAEQLMYEHGYFSTPQLKMLYLRNRLWRAARVVIDAGYHTGKLSDKECMKILTDVVWLDPLGARNEMTYISRSPTRKLAYMIGCESITDLREDYKRKRGKAYSEAAFHERFLKAGAMPIPLVREIVMDDN